MSTKALIGNWDIYLIFETSDTRVFTFRNLQRSRTARWSEHNVLHNKPRSEWIGPGNDELQLEIKLLATLGVKPKTAMKTLKTCMNNGIVGQLFIGGENYGKFYITDITETYDWVMNQGEIAAATLQVTFKEYQ